MATNPLEFSDMDLEELQQSFGSSNELIESVRRIYKPNSINDQHGLQKVTQLLASSSYETNTKWGKEVQLSTSHNLFLHVQCSNDGRHFT